MTARLLKESEAWREIARRIAQRQRSAGLCYEIDSLVNDDTISQLDGDRMERRVRQHMELDPDSGSAWWIPTVGRQYASVRVTAALFLSYEAEEEGK